MPDVLIGADAPGEIRFICAGAVVELSLPGMSDSQPAATVVGRSSAANNGPLSRLGICDSACAGSRASAFLIERDTDAADIAGGLLAGRCVLPLAERKPGSPFTSSSLGTFACGMGTVGDVRLDRVAERQRAVALAHHYREAEGLSIALIAELLGRAPATVKGYFYDPGGEKARAVKARYQGVCRGCGAPTQARNGYVPRHISVVLFPTGLCGR